MSAEARFCAECGNPRKPHLTFGTLIGAMCFGILALVFGAIGMCGTLFMIPSGDAEFRGLSGVGMAAAVIGFGLATLCVTAIVRMVRPPKDR